MKCQGQTSKLDNNEKLGQTRLSNQARLAWLEHFNILNIVTKHKYYCDFFIETDFVSDYVDGY